MRQREVQYAARESSWNLAATIKSSTDMLVLKKLKESSDIYDVTNLAWRHAIVLHSEFYVFCWAYKFENTSNLNVRSTLQATPSFKGDLCVPN